MPRKKLVPEPIERQLVRFAMTAPLDKVRGVIEAMQTITDTRAEEYHILPPPPALRDAQPKTRKLATPPVNEAKPLGGKTPQGGTGKVVSDGTSVLEHPVTPLELVHG